MYGQVSRIYFLQRTIKINLNMYTRHPDLIFVSLNMFIWYISSDRDIITGSDISYLLVKKKLSRGSKVDSWNYKC
jgi:hypothetical protein